MIPRDPRRVSPQLGSRLFLWEGQLTCEGFAFQRRFATAGALLGWQYQLDYVGEGNGLPCNQFVLGVPTRTAGCVAETAPQCTDITKL